MQRTFTIDTHVHIYPHYDVAIFLDTAARRMAGQGVLMLTETAQDDAFARLHSGQLTVADWHTQTYPQDPTAVTLTRGDQRLMLIAGRQIVTAERLEILALGTVQTFADGQGAGDVLTTLRAAQIPAVLPWGVGKWVGKRGKILSDLIATHGTKPGVMLGDNGGRPVGWPTPGIFKTADVPVLPGSDPLPIIGAEQDVGGYTGCLTLDFDDAKPGASITQALVTLRTQPEAMGRRKSLLQVFADQRQLRSNRQN